MICSNCEAEKASSIYVVESGDAPKTIASLCFDCVKDVLVLKIVLRKKKEGYIFDGYIPAESVK